MTSTAVEKSNITPKYIDLFIKHNAYKLRAIYENEIKGKEEKGKGILYIECSNKENIMNINYADDEFMLGLIHENSLKGLKENIPENKILLFTYDKDLNNVYLIHI